MALFMKANTTMDATQVGAAKSTLAAPLTSANGNKASIKEKTANNQSKVTPSKRPGRKATRLVP